MYVSSRTIRGVKIVALILCASLYTQCGWLGDVSINGRAVNSGNLDDGSDPGGNNTIGGGDGSGKKLALYSPQPAGVNYCWPATVTALNNGIATNVSSNVTVSLSSSSQVSFYSSGCSSTSPISSVTISAGSASANFFVKVSQVSSYNILGIDISNTGYATANLTLTSAVLGSAGSPARIGIEGAGAMSAGTCSNYTVTFFDASNVPSSFGAATILTLTADGVGGEWFSGPNCPGAPVNQFSLGASATGTTLSFKSNVQGLANLNVAAGGLSGVYSVLIYSGSTAKLVIEGNSPIFTNECRTYKVVARDAFDNPTAVVSPIDVSLLKSGQGSLMKEGCTGSTSSVKILAGNTAADFSFRSGTAGSATLIAQSGSLTQGNLPVTINPGGTSTARLGFEMASNVTYAGNCHEMTIRVFDAQSNVVADAAAASVNLDDTGAGDFYSDPNCDPAVSAPITSSAINAKVYYRDLKAEMLTLQVSDPSNVMGSGSASLNVKSGPRFKLAIINGPASFPVLECKKFTIAYTDPYGNGVPVNTATDVTLSEQLLDNKGEFFGVEGCASDKLPAGPAAGQQVLHFDAGMHQRFVWFKEAKSGEGRLKAADASVNPGFFKFFASAGAPSKMTASAPPTISNGKCGQVDVTLYDANDNKAPVVGTAIPLQLMSPQGTFSGDSNGSTVIPRIQINVGSSQGSFYFCPNALGNASGTVDGSTSNLGTANFTVAVTQEYALARIAIIGKGSQPLRGPGSMLAGGCISVAARLEDAAGNPVPANNAFQFMPQRYGSPDGKFYKNSTCSDDPAVPEWIIPAGASELVMYYKDKKAGQRTLIAQAAGLPSLSYAVSVTAGATTGISYLGDASSIAGSCVGPFKIAGKDEFGNVSGLPSGTVVSLSGEVSGLYYSKSDCSDATPITSVTVNSPDVGANIYFRDYRAENLQLVASTSNLGSDTLSHHVRVGAPHHIAVIGPTTTQAKRCSDSLFIRIEDAYDNVVIDYDRARDYKLDVTGSVKMHTAGCVAAAPRATIPKGAAMSGEFAFRADTAQDVVLTIQSQDASAVPNKIDVPIKIVPEPIVTKYVDCSSSRYRYATCDAGGTIKGISVSYRYSHAHCIPGFSYGYVGNHIWVNHGCRARFSVQVGGGEVPIVGGWHRVTAASCPFYCKSKGLANVPSPDGSLCASGELRPQSAINAGVQFQFTCWTKPNNNPADCAHYPANPKNGIAEGGFCYGTWGDGKAQVRDYNRTDLTVGCFCAKQ